MFRKLVSGLPFSPALVGQLGFYAKRLKREEATRRLGLVFTALALVVQSFAVFSPPESANAASTSDLIRGGVSSISEILRVYDDSSKDYKKIMDYAGVTRAEIAAMQPSTVNSRDFGTNAGTWLSWGRTSHFSSAEGEMSHNASGTTVYSRPLWRFDSTSWTKTHGSNYEAFRGSSAKLGSFAILKNCANLVSIKTPTPPPTPPQPPKDIKVCRPGTGVITIKDNEKKSTDLASDSEICKPKPEPFATCSSLSAPKKIERTKYSFTATSATKNGATVSNYIFTVRKDNATGAIVKQVTVTSSAASVDSGVLEMKDTGTYYVAVQVTTSLGVKTSDGCAQVLTVAAPDKCAVKPDILANDKECQPCPANTALWYKDTDCTQKVASEKKATNLTQNGVLAATTTANAGDRIQFTISLYNVGKVPAKLDFKENMSDVLEYATLYDQGGGSIVSQNDGKYLNWGSTELKAGEKVSRTFSVKVLDTIPLTARGVSNPTSYDCIMTNSFGNTINIKMNCETPKIVETIVEQLPSTGPTENMIFSSIIAAVVVYFYARSRQLGAEVRLIRRDFNAGTL